MIGLKLDLTKTGLDALYSQPWKIRVLETLLANTGKRFTTNQMHTHIEEEGEPSRPSVIQFLKTLAADGVAQYSEETALGGTRRVYQTEMNLLSFLAEVDKKYMNWYRETYNSIPENLISAPASPHA